MAKKVLGWISCGISVFIVLLFMMSGLMAPGEDYKVFLLILGLCVPFIVTGFIGCLLVDKHKIASGILMIVSIPGICFLGFMTIAGGLSGFAILTMPLSIINSVMYLVSGVMVLATKK